MALLQPTRIRLAADTASFDHPTDLLTGESPRFWRGAAVRLELALFQNGELASVANLTSLTVELRTADEDASAPSDSDPVLLLRTLDSTALDDTLTTTQWSNDEGAHATVEFTAAETSVPAGALWLTVWAATSDDPARLITLTAGLVHLLEDGGGLATTPPEVPESFYTAAQSDALFATRGANLADLSDATAARANLGLGTAATADTGTGAGAVPLLGAFGQLDPAVLPSTGSSFTPAGGILFSGGHATFDGPTFGTGDFDILLHARRTRTGTEEYLLSGELLAFSLRFDASDRLVARREGVADVLTAGTFDDLATTYALRATRTGGLLRLYHGAQLLASLPDSLNYAGASHVLGARDTAGTTPFEGLLTGVMLFTSALTDAEAAAALSGQPLALPANWPALEAFGGYQTSDRAGGVLTLSETGAVPARPEAAFRFQWTLPATGSLGGSARAVLPAGHLLTRLSAVADAAVTLDVGTGPDDSSLASGVSTVNGSTVLPLDGHRSPNNRLHATFTAGSGTVTLVAEGLVV